MGSRVAGSTVHRPTPSNGTARWRTRSTSRPKRSTPVVRCTSRTMSSRARARLTAATSSTTVHRERGFSTGGTESPEVWDGCRRRPAAWYGGRRKRSRRSRAVTVCSFQTSSEHSTSLGRVRYQHCVCGRFRVLLDSDVLTEGTRPRLSTPTAFPHRAPDASGEHTVQQTGTPVRPNLSAGVVTQRTFGDTLNVDMLPTSRGVPA